MTCTVYLALTLDGFIAGPEGQLDWLTGLGDAAEIDSLFQDFMAGIDAIVMGRRTFESALGFGEWSYPCPVAVLSQQPVAVPANLCGRVFHLSGAPPDIVAQMARRGHTRLYVDGGETVRRFLAAGLIDRFVLTQVPRVLGRGTALFGPEVPAMALVHESTEVLTGGMVMNRYTRAPASREAA